MNAERLLSEFEQVSEAPDAVHLLRRFALDLAVRGKLVQQDPSDVPASHLVEQIEDEKARWVASYGRRSGKELPAIGQHEIPFNCPVGWEWVRIRRVTHDRGQTIPSQDFTYIDVTSIDKEAGRVGVPQVLAARDAPSRARKIVGEGDVVYSCVRPYLLNIAVIEKAITPPPIASTAFAVLNGFGLLVPRYTWIVLRSPFTVGWVEAKMRGQAYPAINDADFGMLPFPLPPLAEQHRIVARVDELMALCDQLEASQAKRERRRDRLVAASLDQVSSPANAEKFKQHVRFLARHPERMLRRPEHIAAVRTAVLDVAVRGRLVPQDPADEPANALLDRIQHELVSLAANGRRSRRSPLPDIDEQTMPFRLPPGWEWTRLQSICSSVTDGDHQPPPKSESGIPFLVIGNVRTRSIDFANCRRVSPTYYEKLDSTHKPRQDDILYTLVGSYGIPILVPGDQPFCVQRHIGILRPSAHIDATFLARVLDSGLVFEQATKCATGIAQKTVPLSGLRRIHIPLAPVAEQRRIVAKVDELMKVCDQLERSLNAVNTGRAKLLEAVLREALEEDGGDAQRVIAMAP